MRLILDDHDRPQIDWHDPALRLTTAQREAMDCCTERVLTAGAGAGKTHTLALRYVALLLAQVLAGDCEIDSVLVLTFTERAAAEMAERCTLRLAELVRASREICPRLDASSADRAAGRRLVADLEQLLEQVDRARIGTFHSFCASILREHPAEADTPPGARILDPAEAATGATRVLDSSLRTLIDRDPTALGALLDAFGTRRSLLEAGRIALERWAELRPLLDSHAEGHAGLHEVLAEAPVSAADAHAFIVGPAASALRGVIALTAPSGGGPFVDALRELAGRSPLEPPHDVASTLATYARYRETIDTWTTERNTLRRLTHHRVMGTRTQWPSQRHHALAKRALGALEQRLSGWPDRVRPARQLPTPADQALYGALRPFSQWILDAADALDRALQRERAVTFQVLQRRAVAAVTRSEPLRQRLRARFRYLMVDEFQDTDALQWSMVWALARHDPEVPEDRLFLVGDIKQAIYGFRGGDVTMMRTATQAMAQTPLRLPDNFRSAPPLIDWFNKTFANILGPPSQERPAWEAYYAPLVAGRSDATGQVRVVRGDPELLGTDWQPRAVARWLAHTLSQPGCPWSDRATYPTPPVAILLRTRTRLDAWEHALRAEQVPFVVGQGVGFWRRPEVMDLVNALSALAHDDERSWVGWLRSPVVGLTDDDIQQLREGRLGRDGAAGLLGWGLGPPPTSTSDRLAAAHGRVAALRLAARTRSVAELVGALTDAMRPALAAADPSGQAEANAARLQALVRALPGDRGGLAEVADRLLEQVEAATREPEATVVPTHARVIVLTVHASKGLEFPAVVVPELHRRPQARSAPLVVRRIDGAWRMATRILDPTADVQSRVRPGLLAALDHQRADEEHAEYRRLLYVAVTRARDELVLVSDLAHVADPGCRPTWSQLIEAAGAPATPISAQQWLALPQRRASEPEPRLAPTSADRQRLEPRPGRAELELAASSLDAYAACPARWFRAAILGVPEQPQAAAVRAREIAGLRGQLLHQLLEEGLAHDSEAVSRRWSALAGQVAATLDERRAGLRTLHEHLACTRDREPIRQALRADGVSELAVRRSHAGVTVRGRIDRLWRHAEGWVVLDWKSETLRQTPEVAAARHRRQLLAYAWAAEPVLSARASDPAQRPPIRTQVVFTATGEVADVGHLDPQAVADIEATLERIGATAQGPWAAVRDDAIGSSQPPPCASCGYLGRGCPGATQP